MTDTLFWLTLTVLLTALLWLPYILSRLARQGLMPAMSTATGDDPTLAPWARRAAAAHANAVENLVVFAALILVAHVTAVPDAATVTAAMVYFFARLAHFVIYVAGIPVARTLAFAIGWLATVYVALLLLGAF